MYNSVTALEIAGAPELEGLDREALSLVLTKTFARIITLRSATENRTESAQSPDLDLSELLRIAQTYEALFLAGCMDEETSRKAGFVAGTAYSLSLLAAGGRTDNPQVLGIGSVAPAISAILLFLASGYFADAMEMADRYFPEEGAGNFDHRMTIASITALAKCNMSDLHAQVIDNGDTHGPNAATQKLYGMCGAAILEVGQFFHENDDTSLLQAVAKLEQVETLSVFRHNQQRDGIPAMSMLAGPLQCSKLLRRAILKMAENSLFNVAPPDGCSLEEWTTFLRRVAEDRPILWDQHRRIIADGFLDTGTSAVLGLPTGSGKTSLAELKIAAHVLAGRRAVFIAPTHALEFQVMERMKTLFGNRARRVTDDLTSSNDELPGITVCTPEACLTMLSLFPEKFSDVGLFVFDECHIVHSEKLSDARRSLDAMFCLLEAFQAVTTADFLLMSAMIRNVEHISTWIQGITQRRCLPVLDGWKPTRQVRGCVVYKRSDIDALNRRVTTAYRTSTNQGPSAELKRNLFVKPYAFFCLRDGWTTVPSDYALLPAFAGEDVLLAAGGTRRNNHRWWLSPNRNQVAASLAGSYARHGLKTLVFCNDIKSTSSVVAEADSRSQNIEPMSHEENTLWAQLVVECGSASSLYHEVGASSGVHHALLFAEERRLIESLFLRDSGLDLLAATPTLAQGLNLPAEIVVIAGDDRYDPHAESARDRQRLEAHELLNAAGRAGRAGHFAQGMVLIVPGRIVDLDEENYQISGRWLELQDQFARSDQCVDVADPLSLVFSAISEGETEVANVKYALARLHPHSGSSAAFRRRMSNSLWASEHGPDALAGDLDSLVAQIGALDFPDISGLDERLVELSQNSGTAIGWLQAMLLRIIEDFQAISSFTVQGFLEWMTQLTPFLDLLKLETVETARKYAEGGTNEAISNLIMQVSAEWVKGTQIEAIEQIFRQQSHALPKCGRTRVAVLRWIPDVAYVAGLVRNLYVIAYPEEAVPVCLQVLQRCLRLGLQSPEMLAFLHLQDYNIMRVQCHRKFSEIDEAIEDGNGETEFSEVLRRVARVI